MRCYLKFGLGLEKNCGIKNVRYALDDMSRPLTLEQIPARKPTFTYSEERHAVCRASDRDFPIKNPALLVIGEVTTPHAEPAPPGRPARNNADFFVRPWRRAQPTDQGHIPDLFIAFALDASEFTSAYVQVSTDTGS